ncbi:MAG: DsrE family protein, partial [Methylococcales bacterium]|nr:DsrE family protein [Methylococcales bacterium]
VKGTGRPVAVLEFRGGSIFRASFVFTYRPAPYRNVRQIQREEDDNMRLGIIIETNEPEKAWNGVRFGNAALKQGHEVKIFLMSAGVEIERITHEKYNAKTQLDEFSKNNGILLACGTCLKSRDQSETDVCPISTMIDCVDMVEWAEKIVTF